MTASRADAGYAIGSLRLLLCILTVAAGCSTDSPVSQEWIGTCDFAVEQIAVLEGDEVGRGVLTSVGPEQIYATYRHAPAEVVRYSRSGDHLGAMTRAGEGPGEYRSVTAVVPFEDSILIVDGVGARAGVHALDGTFVRSFRLSLMPFLGAAVNVGDSLFLLAGQIADQEGRFGTPAMIIDRTGEVEAYIGTNRTEPSGPLAGRMVRRHIAFNDSLGIVTLKNISFSLESFSTSGSLQETWDIDNDWFHWPPDLSSLTHGSAGEPESVFVGLQFDAQGRLWTMALIPDAEWEGAVQNGQIVDFEGYTDTRIDVLDLSQPEPELCHAVTDGRVVAFAGTGLVRRYEEDRRGRPRNSIYQLTLRP